MDLVSIFRILYRQWYYLLGFPLVASALAILLTADLQKVYRSNAQLATNFTISEDVNVTGKKFNIFEADIKFNNLIETINSTRVLSLLGYQLLLHDLNDKEKAFRTVDLDDEESGLSDIEIDKVKKIISNKLDSMNLLDTHVDEERNAKRVLVAYEYDDKSLSKSLSINRINRTDYVSVLSFTENPYLSAYMVNELCDQFFRFNSSLINARTDGTVRTFTRLLMEKKKELDRVSLELERIKSSTSMVNYLVGRESKFTKLSDIEQQLDDEKTKLRSLQLQLNEIDRKIRNQDLSDSDANLDVIRTRNKLNELNNRYTSGGSRNTALKDSIDELRGTLQRLIRIAANSKNSAGPEELLEERSQLEVDIKISEQNISALQTNLHSSTKNVAGFASKEARIEALEREVELASEDYRKAQTKYNESINVAMASSNSIQQILYGYPASEAEPSKRLIIVGLSGSSIFIFIAVILILLDYLDISIRNRSNFTSNVSLNLMGVLNHINLDKTDIYALFNKDFAKSGHNMAIFRDQLRKLRYNIMNWGKQVILFTSTKENEGKSLIIKALATAISQGRSKVLIIDCNFGRNELTKSMNANPLLEKALASDELYDINLIKKSNLIKKTNLEGVHIIGCEGGDYSPVEIINGSSFENLLDQLKTEYDFIFLEGASLNNNSDSRELTIYTDIAICVFSAKSSLEQLDYESIEFLTNLNGIIVGAVLNDVQSHDFAT